MSDVPLPSSVPQTTPTRQIVKTTANLVITSGALAAGQVVLGERDANAIFVRSVAGAIMAEIAAAATRAAAAYTDRPEPETPLWLARSYHRAWSTDQ